MMGRVTRYTQQWRNEVRAGAISSAAVIADLAVNLWHPATMIDVGGGEGHLAHAFGLLGTTGLTVEGDDAITTDCKVDLAHPPYPDLGTFDLATCLEVAEHVPEKHADALVAWLCSLAPLVLFSAAIPGQGGHGHVNEQPPGYWVERFASHRFVGTGALRWRLWDDERVEPWYAQNLLAFIVEDHAHFDFTSVDLPLDGCPYVIHPGIWKCYRP